MIEVTVYKDSQGLYKGFKSLGHAGYAEEGYDIICSAVSVLVINTLNAIEALTPDRFKVESDQEQGLIDAEFTNGLGHDSTVLMNAMILGLEMIREDYNKGYINLKIKEV